MNFIYLWNPDDNGTDIFRLTMSLHRFRFLLCCIRFDDKQHDRQACSVRDLFEIFVANCLRNYSPPVMRTQTQTWTL